MPFAFLMTDVLRRREERDVQLGRTKEYIDKRTTRELWNVTAASLGTLVVVSALVGEEYFPVALRSVAGIVGAITLIVFFARFLRSVIRE